MMLINYYNIGIKHKKLNLKYKIPVDKGFDLPYSQEFYMLEIMLRTKVFQRHLR